MTELTNEANEANEANEEIIMRVLTINELESINGGFCAWDIWSNFDIGPFDFNLSALGGG